MEMIPNDMLARFNMLPFEVCMERHPGDEITFWETFLIQTDYIPAKIVEAQLAGDTLDEDYSEVLEARKLCRQKINELRGEEGEVM